METRDGAVRNFLNIDDMLAHCANETAWNFESQPRIKRVQCRRATFRGKPEDNVALARSADVLIIVHGAGEVRCTCGALYVCVLTISLYTFLRVIDSMQALQISLLGLQVKDDTRNSALMNMISDDDGEWHCMTVLCKRMALHDGAVQVQANAFMMHPGSSVLELRPYQFGSIARKWCDS